MEEELVVLDCLGVYKLTLLKEKKSMDTKREIGREEIQ